MVGRPVGIPHSHASGEREMLSNLPQSRTLLVPQPECSRLRRALEQARTVGHDIREWLDTPVKQHELVRRLQHDVAREHGFDMRDRVSRQNRTEPERVKSPSRGFSMGF